MEEILHRVSDNVVDKLGSQTRAQSLPVYVSPICEAFPWNLPEFNTNHSFIQRCPRLREALDLKTTVCAAKNRALTVQERFAKNMDPYCVIFRNFLPLTPNFNPKFRNITNFRPLQCTFSLIDPCSALSEAWKYSLKIRSYGRSLTLSLFHFFDINKMLDVSLVLVFFNQLRHLTGVINHKTV